MVGSFDELLQTPLRDGVNALCWPRCLPGDFAEVARLLSVPPGITHLGEEDLQTLELTAAGRAAVRIMLADVRCLQEHGLDPVLDCVNGYTHPVEPPHQRTDVCSWHVDSATAEADTWLCTYHGRPTEGLDPEDALRRVDDPVIRAALLAHHGGVEDDDFVAFLRDGSFDLHFAPRAGATPWSFGVGHLWRIAVDWPGARVPACIHRAPTTGPGDEPRLLLIC